MNITKVDGADIFSSMGGFVINSDDDNDNDEKKKKKHKNKGEKKGGKKDKKMKEKKMEPEDVFNREIEVSRLEIAKMMCRINGIDPKTFFVKTKKGLYSKPISTRITTLDENDFIYRSNLGWKDSYSYSVDSLKFRLRFLSVMMEEISNKLDKMAKQRYRLSDEKWGLYENGYFHIKTIMTDIQKLSSAMTVNTQINYRNNLLITIFDTSYGGPKKYNPKKNLDSSKHNPKDLNGRILAGVRALQTGLNPKNLFTDKLMEDDIAMYNIFRIAYMLSTGNDDNSNLFSFKVLEGHSKDDNLTSIIKALGTSILKSHAYGTPIVYKAFHEARPIISANISGEYHDSAVIMGVEALYMVKFVCNDEKITKFINCMLGIKDKKSKFFSF